MKQKNKFQCLGTLGEGSYGVVYKLEDAKGRIFALKEIRVKPFDTESALKEIDVMKTFLHPNLVKIYDYNFDS